MAPGFIVDGTGGGDVDFNTTGQSLADGAVKDYTGRTIIRNGTLRVNETAVQSRPRAWRLMEESSASRLSLQNTLWRQHLGADRAGCGAIRQDDGESVTLKNNISVSADSASNPILTHWIPFGSGARSYRNDLRHGGLAIKSAE